MSWEWMLFGGVMMLLFWGGLIALTVIVIRAFTGSRQSGKPGSTSQTALDILKERYARGEITKDEYESIRRDLMT